MSQGSVASISSDGAPMITYTDGWCCCSGVGFQLTPNRKDWTGWRNSAKLFWTFKHGTEHQQPKQKVSSQTRPAVGTWGRAYCNYMTGIMTSELQEVCFFFRGSISNMAKHNVSHLDLSLGDIWLLFISFNLNPIISVGFHFYLLSYSCHLNIFSFSLLWFLKIRFYFDLFFCGNQLLWPLLAILFGHFQLLRWNFSCSLYFFFEIIHT